MQLNVLMLLHYTLDRDVPSVLFQPFRHNGWILIKLVFSWVSGPGYVRCDTLTAQSTGRGSYCIYPTVYTLTGWVIKRPRHTVCQLV